MSLRGCLMLICGVAMLMATLHAQATPAIEERLQQADKLRSAEPAKFKDLLAALNDEHAGATPAQLERLEYLNAYALAYGGDYAKGIQKARALVDGSRDPELRFRAAALVVNSYAVTREFTEGLRYLVGMLELVDEIKDKELRHTGLGVAALIYNQVGQYELGRHYAQMILADDPAARSRCYAGLLRVEAMQNLGSLPADDTDVLAVIDQCVSQSERLLANLVRAQLARKWAGEGKTDRAATLLAANLDEVEATRYPRLVGEIHALLAEYRLAQDQIEAAQVHAERAVDQSTPIGFSLPLQMAHKVLYDIAMRRGDTATALTQYRLYAQADKAYLDSIKARELAVQFTQHEMLQKTQTIELLNKQNQVLQLEQQVSKQATTNTQLLLALALLLLASLSLWAWRARRVQRVLRQMAEIDGLTGISNRRHFSAQASALLATCAKTGGSACLIMFDLDRFKYINDHYGHATGDWVLRQIGDVCKPLIARNDCFGRIGGEEFAVVLSGGGVEAGRELALQMRARIAAIDARANGGTFNISASFGVTATRLSGYDLDRLLAHADEVLYASKHQGRNRVSVYQGAPAAAGQL